MKRAPPGRASLTPAAMAWVGSSPFCGSSSGCGCSSVPPLSLGCRRWGDDGDDVGVPLQSAVDGSSDVEAHGQLKLGALPGLCLPAVETTTTSAQRRRRRGQDGSRRHQRRTTHRERTWLGCLVVCSLPLRSQIPTTTGSPIPRRAPAARVHAISLPRSGLASSRASRSVRGKEWPWLRRTAAPHQAEMC